MRRRARSGSRGAKPPRGSSGYRLITKTPLVYLGPGALGALEQQKGILLGAQRPGWVDALAFDPAPNGDWKDLIERRFRQGSALEPVGVVLSRPDFRRLGRQLFRDLVPGDVVLTVPARAGRPRAYVNRGDGLAPARLKVSRASAS